MELAMWLALSVVWFYGFALYAKAKGYSARYALLGIFSFIGLVVLLLLPDKHKGEG